MAKKINRLFRKILILILNGLGVSTLLGCPVAMYGMPENYRSVDGTVRGKDTNNDSIGEPIPGIQYTYKGQKPELLFDEDGNQIGERTPLTDEDGNFYVSLWDSEESITVTFKDIDGEANGSYKDREVTFTFSEENHFVSKDVDLEPKE